MKLKDLFEDRQHETKASLKNYSGKLSHSDAAWDDPKSGSFSSVKDDNKDPHMVKKYHHGPLGKQSDDEEIMDAYVFFALWMTKQNINNPCLPRIYDIKKIKDKTGKFIYKYQIERLISGTELEVDDLWQIYDRYFVRNENTEKIVKQVKYRFQDPNEAKNMVRVMGSACEAYIEGKFDMISDDSLKEALDLVAKFVKEYSSKGFTLDIENSGNIMFRRGPYGYQLVLSDPVA